MLLKRPMGSTSSNVNGIILKVTLGIHCTYIHTGRWVKLTSWTHTMVISEHTWLFASVGYPFNLINTDDRHTRFFVCVCFSVRFLSLPRGHSDFSYSPQRPMTSDFEGFSIPHFIHYIYFEKFLRKSRRYFPFLTLSAKQGHYLVPFL